MEEHRVIEKIADVLVNVSAKLREGEEISLNDLESIIDFIRVFADKCHHGKEEGVLFPMLMEKGMPRQSGPIAVMLYEHERGREAVRMMREGLDMLVSGNNEGVSIFSKGATAYASLIREHIMKEDEILYVMARNLLDDSDMESMMKKFVNVERKIVGEGVHEKYIALAEKLWSKYVR